LKVEPGLQAKTIFEYLQEKSQGDSVKGKFERCNAGSRTGGP
jgi:hypothetical protein